METKRVAILGAGFMAGVHGNALLECEGVSPVGICDINQAQAESCRDALGKQIDVYTDFEKMLDSAKPDILYVCIPPFAHNGQVELAASRGIHIFMEKPIALTEERAESMVQAAEAAGIITQVGYHMRFRESVRRMKGMIDNGDAGLQTLFTGRYWCNMEGSSWWRDQSKSGGQILEQIIHLYDLATFFLGKPVSVSGCLANLCHQDRTDYTIEDTSAGMINFENGGVATIAGSNCAIPGSFFGDYRLVCEKAVLDYKTTGQEWVEKDQASIYKTAGEELLTENITETVNPYLEETLHFVECIRKGCATDIPLSQGLASLKLVQAVIKSAEQGGEKVML